MATWKYGPVTIIEDGNGYLPPEEVSYEVQYNTTSDILSVLRNNEHEASWEYFSARKVAKMITTWYLSYVLNYDNEFIEKLFNDKKDRL